MNWTLLLRSTVLAVLVARQLQAAPPSFISLTLDTVPSGLPVTGNGLQGTSPMQLTVATGTIITISVNATESASANTRYQFVSWSDSGAQSHSITVPASDTTITSTFKTQYKLAASASPLGEGTIHASPTSGDGFYDAGTSIILTASAHCDYSFLGWSGDASGNTNPLTISLTGPKTIVGLIGVLATIDTSPTGLQVLVDNVAHTAPYIASFAANSTHTIAVAATQPVNGSSRYRFSGWSDSGALSHTVTPEASTTYVATHVLQYLLTTSSVPSNSATFGVAPASGDGYFDAGTSVSVTAIPAGGVAFHHWSGDLAQGTVNTDNPIAVPINQARTVSANQYVSITINSAPSGRQIAVDGVEVVAPQTYSWPAGSKHVIGAITPQGSVPNDPKMFDSRYRFTSWSDAGDLSHTLTAGTSTTYTASYLQQFRLSATSQPANGGTISAQPISADGFYDSGSSIQLSFTPNTGYQFGSWEGSISGNTNTHALTMTAPMQVIANLTTSCTFRLSRPATSIMPSGDLGRVSLFTGDGCSWTAISSSNWITVLSGGSGSGNGSVRYQVSANPSNVNRSGKLTIAGIDFPVSQAASSCAYAIDPNSQTAPPAQASYSLQVTTPSGCSWTPVSTASWISLTSDGQTQQSTAALPYALQSNAQSQARAASIEAGGQTLAILQQGIVTTQMYGDVLPTNPFVDYITMVAQKGIMSGCGSGNFCPDKPLTRAEISEAVVRALYGDTFPFSPSPYFSDVPSGHPQFRFIQKMKEIGVTAGCTEATFCPDATATRGEMAVFLTRARLSVSSAGVLPFTGAPYFSDVLALNSFFPFIQKIRESGITTGCSATQYCPTNLVTKGQMAVFIVRALLIL